MIAKEAAEQKHQQQLHIAQVDRSHGSACGGDEIWLRVAAITITGSLQIIYRFDHESEGD